MKVYKHGTAMLTQLEYFESTDDKIPLSLTCKEQPVNSVLPPLPHEHTELEILIIDLV